MLLTAALIVLFEGAYGVVLRLESELSAATAAAAVDVWLEGAFPGAFSLHARGHATEIRTGPIVSEEAVIGVERRGEHVTRTIFPRASLEVRVISDLRDGAKEVELSLYYDQGGGHGRWPHDGTAAAMTEFLRAAQLVRRYQAAKAVLGREELDRDISKLANSELDAVGDRMQQPWEIGFDITYWNSDRTQQWKRSELLVYEPRRQMAFVRHNGRPMPITRNSSGANVARDNSLS